MSPRGVGVKKITVTSAHIDSEFAGDAVTNALTEAVVNSSTVFSMLDVPLEVIIMAMKKKLEKAKKTALRRAFASARVTYSLKTPNAPVVIAPGKIKMRA
jgi:hypothetical protein